METLHGRTQGLKADQSRALRALYDRASQPSELVSGPLARALTELSNDIKRKVGLLIDRRGRVDKVIVGDAHRVFIPELGARRAGESRFRGVRLVLTGFGPEGLTEELLTDLSLLRLDAVIVIRVGERGLPGTAEMATLLPPGQLDGKMWRCESAKSVSALVEDWDAFIGDLESQFSNSLHLRKVEGAPGAILVGVTLQDHDHASRNMVELGRLAETAGLRVLDSALQRRRKIDGKSIVGSGKLQELILRSMHLGAEVLVFDRELSPTQLRNIATATDLKVLDRTQLILDIFAQHAISRAGKLQVEFAQLRYRMPRLALMPTAMSRLTGGIGGRGPGETKLEINRRRAQERLARLKKELKSISKQRGMRRQRRQKRGVPVAGIVGYTNAGKSTLLNRVTNSEVIAQDKLFATLDPTSRRFRFPTEREVVLTDTVGFIQQLPETLKAAFAATLEELHEADILVHVLDASDPAVRHHKVSVEEVLEGLELGETKALLVWNKCDLAAPLVLDDLLNTYGGLAVSALTGQGTEKLLKTVEDLVYRIRSR